MDLSIAGLRKVGLVAVLGVALAVLARPAVAGDLTLGYTSASPGEVWSGGYAVALGIGFFSAATFEAEYGHQGAEAMDSKVDTFTASAMLVLPTGRLQPYGGLGVGVFREAIASDSDTGTHRAFILGAKLTLGLLVVKSDYRWIHVPDDALLPFDRRFQIAGGIHF